MPHLPLRARLAGYDASAPSTGRATRYGVAGHHPSRRRPMLKALPHGSAPVGGQPAFPRKVSARQKESSSSPILIHYFVFFLKRAAAGCIHHGARSNSRVREGQSTCGHMAHGHARRTCLSRMRRCGVRHSRSRFPRAIVSGVVMVVGHVLLSVSGDVSASDIGARGLGRSCVLGAQARQASGAPRL